MTDVDLIKILGYGGWKIDSQEIVTADNQVSNAAGLLPGCSLATKAKLYEADATMPMYLPPLGWTVIVATKDDDVEYVWIDPTGTAWLPSKCSNVKVGSSGALPQVSSAGGGGLVWLLLGGVVLWFLLKDGS